MAGVRDAPTTSCCPRPCSPGRPGMSPTRSRTTSLRLGDPDPAKRPTTAQALAESQRLRERIIAADAR